MDQNDEAGGHTVETEAELNTHERVVSRLEELVFRELEPGSELPSESELSADLSVSRLTVREAVRSLQARGLIEVRHGKRPIVARLSSAAVQDFFAASLRQGPRTMLELLEVRRALEVQITALAAGRVNRTAASAMSQALDDMRANTGDPDAFDLADVRFHEALAAASGNQIMTFLIEAMAHPMRASRMQSRRGHVARNRPLVQVIDEHTRIYDLVISGDATGAAAAMRDHLDQTEHSLWTAIDLPPDDDATP
ncbi:FadR/GntR family transcriptional regulator [Phytoactinopolyspora mesophila]|uniref:FCD domain-containing protein n=1 Tax=Phytoactinopolyspora mesophila TaxID=2650750 RepID=A0A7K3M1F8_9ACTN|nr:FadR/GntR family transcriptional regulator [Phytoactinopolyspora mesophila]NDL57114.1 FCD domain-containing protein [Phytoactinopolyspora mesophila]